jgi:hypothetical protein
VITQASEVSMKRMIAGTSLRYIVMVHQPTQY